ncbi:MAG: RNA-binding protein [Caulobacterales bacterium]
MRRKEKLAKRPEAASPLTMAEVKPIGPKHRERRCAATGETLPEAALVRFALGPDDVIVPDVAAKLPGRGVWVSANREALNAAIKKSAFAKSLKAPAKASSELTAQTESLLARRCLDLLGMAKRAGALAVGFTAVEGAIRGRKPYMFVEASDGEADGRERLARLVFGLWGVEPAVCGAFTSAELGMALGRDRVIHACLLEERMAQAWAAELSRLSGFRAIVPNSWPPSWRARRLGPSDGASPAPDDDTHRA